MQAELLKMIIDFLKEKYGHRHTDCGGDFSPEAPPDGDPIREPCDAGTCRHFHYCLQNQKDADKIEKMEKMAEVLTKVDDYKIDTLLTGLDQMANFLSNEMKTVKQKVIELNVTRSKR